MNENENPDAGGKQTAEPDAAENKPESESVSSVTIDDLGSVKESLPEVNQEAIDAFEQKRREADEKLSDEMKNLRDKDGNAFDPEIHETDENGNPKKNYRGLLKMRRGAKKKKPQPEPGASFVNAEKAPGAEPGESQPAISESYAAAFTVVEMTDGAAIAFIAPEMGASDPEKKFLTDCWAKYLDSKGVSDIPPGVALCMGLLTVYGGKLRHEKPRSKVSELWRSVKYYGGGILAKLRRKNGKEKHGARADSRNDVERKDASGESPLQQGEN